jgi:integrase
MRVSFLLRNPEKVGKTAIYASICYRNKRVIVFPGESIDTKNWNNEKNIKKPKQISANNALIGRLNRKEQLYRDVYDDLQKTIAGVIPPKTLKQAIYDITKPSATAIENSPVLVTDFFTTLIADSKSGERLGQKNTEMTEQSIKTYTTAMNHFTEFQTKQRRKLYLTDIDQKIIDAFAKFLNIDKKLSLNSSGKYLKIFKTLMNYAKKKKLVDGNILIENKITVTREISDSIYLDDHEINALMDIKHFISPLYEVVRDLFIFGCKSGLRFSDYSSLRLESINHDFMEVITKKTQTKLIIPVHNIIKPILLKYPNGIKCPSNQVFNRYLKEIGEQVPELHTEFEKKITISNKPVRTIYKKYQLLQSHTARRSFCTNEILKGTPLNTIMAMTGHKTEKSFFTYTKATSIQQAQLLKKEWERRGE